LNRLLRLGLSAAEPPPLSFLGGQDEEVSIAEPARERGSVLLADTLDQRHFAGGGVGVVGDEV
jgi:hypothetical protein